MLIFFTDSRLDMVISVMLIKKKHINQLKDRPFVWITGRLPENLQVVRNFRVVHVVQWTLRTLKLRCTGSFADFVTNCHGLCFYLLMSQISWLRLLFLTFLSYRINVLPRTMIFLIYPLFTTSRGNRDLFQKKSFFLVEAIRFTRSHFFSWKPNRLVEIIPLVKVVPFSGSCFVQQRPFPLVGVAPFSESDSFECKRILLSEIIPFS